MSKRGYEFSFAWIFTLFIGAAVIAAAIMIATQIVGMKQAERDAARGLEIGVLLTPVETALEDARFAKIIVPDETILFNEVREERPGNPFGSQRIGASIKPGFNAEWKPLSGVQSTFHNKYIFTPTNETYAEESFYVLAKPLKLPFKIADLIIIWGGQEKFCFTNPPVEVKAELLELNMTNIYVSNCPTGPEVRNICFGTTCGGGGISVAINSDHTGKIVKDGKTLHYVESFGTDRYGLMYAAIFSDPEIYERQVSRLMAHAGKLEEIYQRKANSFGSSCYSSNAMSTALGNYKSHTESIASGSGGISTATEARNLFAKAEGVNNANAGACLLF